MITGKSMNTIFTAIVPLYVAMILAYGSVKWWRILTPAQCGGINRFVSIFAVPLLSFQYISGNNPYEMSVKFILADTVSKLFVLLCAGLWALYAARGSLEWMITLFVLTTIPNTLVMGTPLLAAMYGEEAEALTIQAVVLQGAVWYTLLLIMYEIRAARILITQQFPDNAASIVSFRVDSDVTSIDGREPVVTEAEVGDDGKLRVTVRRSESSSSTSHLTGAEIYSSHSSVNLTPRESSFNQGEVGESCSGRRDTHDVSSLRSLTSENVRDVRHAHMRRLNSITTPPRFAPPVYVQQKPRSGLSPGDEPDVGHEGRNIPELPGVIRAVSNPVFSPRASEISARRVRGPLRVPKSRSVDIHDAKELHMFVWSENASPNISDPAGGLHVYGGRDLSMGIEEVHVLRPDPGISAGNRGLNDEHPRNSSRETRNRSGLKVEDVEDKPSGWKNKLDSVPTAELATADDLIGAMPPTSVMIKLICVMTIRKLIYNPNTYATCLGVIWSLVAFRWNFKMPGIIYHSYHILSDAGLGMAMFSLGLFMGLGDRIVACGVKLALYGMFLRFLISPALLAAASYIVGIRGVTLKVCILQAALPQGIVPFVFAREYNVHPEILSTAVIFEMLVALPILLLYYILFGL